MHLTASHFGNWPFPFPLAFGLSLPLLPLGPRGELLVEGGAAGRRQSTRDTSMLIQVMGHQMWKPSCKTSAECGAGVWSASYSFWMPICGLFLISFLQIQPEKPAKQWAETPFFSPHSLISILAPKNRYQSGCDYGLINRTLIIICHKHDHFC